MGNNATVINSMKPTTNCQLVDSDNWLQDNDNDQPAFEGCVLSPCWSTSSNNAISSVQCQSGELRILSSL